MLPRTLPRRLLLPKLASSLPQRSSSVAALSSFNSNGAPPNNNPSSSATPKKPTLIPPPPSRPSANPTARPTPSGATTPGDLPLIFKVNEANFNELVVRSPTPILLELEATWCGPCQRLYPILKKVVEELKGQVRLAKLDTDENPRVAQALNVRSLPTVMSLKDGAVVNSFIGLISEEEVKKFVNQLLAAKVQRGQEGEEEGTEGGEEEGGKKKAKAPGPRKQQTIGEITQEVAAAVKYLRDDRATREDVAEMLPLLQRATAIEVPPPTSSGVDPKMAKLQSEQAETIKMLAYAGILRCALIDKDTEAVSEIVAFIQRSFSKTRAESLPEVKQALASASLYLNHRPSNAPAPPSKSDEKSSAEATSSSSSSSSSPEQDVVAALERKVKEHPNDHAASLDLAKAYVQQGNHQAAVNRALELLRKDRSSTSTRTFLIDLFASLGSDSPITKEGRRRMSAIIL